MTAVRASVAIPRPVRRLFTYAVPPELLPRCQRGVRVVVPFGRRKLTGYLLGISEAQAPGEPDIPLKEVEEVLDPEPLLDDTLLEMTRWAADYYVASWGEMIRIALPGMKAVVRKELAITEAGRAALNQGDVGIGEATRRRGAGRQARLWEARGRDVLALVAQYSAPDGTGIRIADLKRKLGAELKPATLTRLRRAGLVRDIEVTAAPGPRPRTSEYALLATAPPGAEAAPGRGDGVDSPPSSATEPAGRRARGERQRQLLRLLEERGGEAEVGALLRSSGASRASLIRLRELGLVTIERRRSSRLPLALQMPTTMPATIRPTEAQRAAIEAIASRLRQGRFSTSLLHGVTGSGKTEVYIHSIETAVRSGRRALYLVPEIGLTPLLARRLRSRFGEILALLHSGLSEGERCDEWRRIKRGEVKVVLGARSAVFAPLGDLGLIVVDEEHDPAFKQEEYPRYNGRDLAILRGRMSEAVVILGSATPSMESYRWATSGRYDLLKLPHRIGAPGLPPVERVDMRREFKEVGRESILSRRLAAAVEERLERREQTLILLNRRGFSTFVLCRACGAQVYCRRCSITMTLHLRQRQLRCHYCDDRRKVPDACPECGSDQLHFGGTGTERLEEALSTRFAGARIARMDRDTVAARGAVEKLLTRFERGDLDILLGTQMIAKGHDFPNVTLVGVLAADALLGMPDFRAGERTFQLLTQVAGRSGRREQGGEVIVQAYYSDHHAIRFACGHDFEGFASEELKYRRLMAYPPFRSLALLLVRDRSFAKARSGAVALAEILRRRRPSSVEVLGPAPAPLERLRGQYRVQVLLKGASRRAIQSELAAMQEEVEARRLRLPEVVIDVDPMSTM